MVLFYASVCRIHAQFVYVKPDRCSPKRIKGEVPPLYYILTSRSYSVFFFVINWAEMDILSSRSYLIFKYCIRTIISGTAISTTFLAPNLKANYTENSRFIEINGLIGLVNLSRDAFTN